MGAGGGLGCCREWCVYADGVVETINYMILILWVFHIDDFIFVLVL